MTACNAPGHNGVLPSRAMTWPLSRSTTDHRPRLRAWRSIGRKPWGRLNNLRATRARGAAPPLSPGVRAVPGLVHPDSIRAQAKWMSGVFKPFEDSATRSCLSLDSASLTHHASGHVHKGIEGERGQGCGHPRDRVTAALAGRGPGARRGSRAADAATARVSRGWSPDTADKQPTPATPPRAGAPKATGGVLQIGEPSRDGARYEGPPAPPAEHGLSIEISRGERRKVTRVGSKRYMS